MQDHIEYETLVQNALRNVVRDVLADVAENGLPGEHHFYISFATQAPGVRISPRLKARFPKTMTIVLQHRFWDMEVGPQSFTVRLSFGGMPEKLVIPFAAMQGFYDPSAAFEVAFNAGPAGKAAAPAPQGEGIVAFPPPGRSGAEQDSKSDENAPAGQSGEAGAEAESAAETGEAETAAGKADNAAAPAPAEPNSAAETEAAKPPAEHSASIVSLDAFRKK